MLEKTLESPLDYKRSNQSILKEISPEYSLDGLMLKLKFQYSCHLLQRIESLQKTLILGRIEGGRRRGLQGIFTTQELNSGLLHYRRILYQLSHKGSHKEWI